MTVFIIIVSILVFFYFVGKHSKKPIEIENTNQIEDVEEKKNNAYKLYTNWCKNKNETPMTKEEFEKLTNERGTITLTDLLKKHDQINLNQNTTSNNETIAVPVNEYDDQLNEESDKQKEVNEKFVNSTIVGYVTNSTTKGALFGGSLLGGMFGDYLNKKKKK